jgi:hypothetical protein
MTTQMAIGGATERAATTLFGVLFLIALVRAFVCIRRRQVPLHREWMIRAFSLGLAVATIRPIVGAFFATRSVTHLTPAEFFGIAFWLGFTIHLIAAEAWINYTRPGVASGTPAWRVRERASLTVSPSPRTDPRLAKEQQSCHSSVSTTSRSR